MIKSGEFKVRIPKGLGLALANNRKMRKALDSWLVMKELANGCISLRDFDNVAEACKISPKTLERRLCVLSEEGLCEIKHGNIYLASYRKLAEYCELPFHDRYYYWVYDELSPKIEYVLVQKAIYEKKKECKNAWHFKINANPGLELELRKIANGVAPDKVLYNQLWSYAEPNTFSISDQAALDPHLHRADFELSYKRYSEIFGFASKGAFAYRKRQLQQLGLIEVNKRSVELNRANKTTELSRETKLGTHKWFRPVKQLVLVLPDELKIRAFNRLTA